MLINFETENFYSFYDSSILSMEKGKRLRKFPENIHKINKTKNKQNIDLLKTAMIFGPNASGKSNFIKALQHMKFMVLNSPGKFTDKLPYRGFSFKESREGKKDSTIFSIEFISNNIQYLYSFEYNREIILKESLSYISGNDYVVYFDRTSEGFTKNNNNLIQFEKYLRKNVLFLYLLQNFNDEHSKNIIDWFANQLMIINKDDTVDLQRIIDQNIKIIEEDFFKGKLLSFLKLADLNIVDIQTEEEKIEVPEKIRKVYELLLDDEAIQNELPTVAKNFYTVYKSYNLNGKYTGMRRIPLSMDSSGTQKLISIAVLLLSSLYKNKVLVIDKFDDSFHLQISVALLKLFNSNSFECQFILTSHELELMDCGMRKDQVYFVEKEFNGESELYSLFDFKDSKDKSRNDITYGKRYMEGKYGAIPNVHSDRLIDLLNETTKDSVLNYIEKGHK